MHRSQRFLFSGPLKNVRCGNSLKLCQAVHMKRQRCSWKPRFDCWICSGRVWKESTMRRQWSCWRQPRTVWSWWCVTPPRCWRRWRLALRSSGQPGAASSSNCSSSSSSSSKPHSKTTCRRWEDSLFFPKVHWQHPRGPSQRQTGAGSSRPGHLPGDRDRLGQEPTGEPCLVGPHGWAGQGHGELETGPAGPLLGQEMMALGVAWAPGLWTGWREPQGGQSGAWRYPWGLSQHLLQSGWAELILWYISTWFFLVKMHFENTLKALANSGASFQLTTLRSKATLHFWLIWKKSWECFFLYQQPEHLWQIRIWHQTQIV